ncbi:hypothetical protein HPB48_024403 [Haemaphysalis longicornis]|uniref:thioredoxin-dependent peroxiredoxin n=1 Tax=Haemaphysalis longicornis TaxID=44386 RepID=A0A9J6H6N0_HAELO|nr:hypothetical protein HPB48_024403 [Haemaphysalis longicornis]
MRRLTATNGGSAGDGKGAARRGKEQKMPRASPVATAAISTRMASRGCGRWFLVAFSFAIVAQKLISAEEACRSFGGEVYPQEYTKSSAHNLHWSKTQSGKQGGLGPIKIPLLSDLTHQISKDYGVYLEDLGHTLRGLFIIDDKGNLRQITMNDLPVGRLEARRRHGMHSSPCHFKV